MDVRVDKGKLTKPARGTKEPPLRSGFSAPAGGVRRIRESMEPESVNKLVEEAEELKKEVLGCFNGNPPEKIEYLFGDTSYFFSKRDSR